MVAGGRRPPSCKLWHLYRWSYTASIRPPSATRDKVTVSVVLQRESHQARSRTKPIHNHVCMTARLDVTPKTTEQNQTVYTSKSEAEVTNNKTNCAWGRPIILLTQQSYTHRHEASRGLSATAELLVGYVDGGHLRVIVLHLRTKFYVNIFKHYGDIWY